MDEIELKMTLEEAAAIVKLLGTLPTHQGAFPLYSKLKLQLEARYGTPEQLPKEAG